jgi:hypothetical protein
MELIMPSVFFWLALTVAFFLAALYRGLHLLLDSLFILEWPRSLFG